MKKSLVSPEVFDCILYVQNSTKNLGYSAKIDWLKTQLTICINLAITGRKPKWKDVTVEQYHSILLNALTTLANKEEGKKDEQLETVDYSYLPFIPEEMRDKVQGLPEPEKPWWKRLFHK